MPRKPHTHHYIYKITCNVTGKYYIGMHSTSNLEDSYFGSGTVLWRSIKKYGRNTHIKEILEFLPDRLTLKTRESELVNIETLKDCMCMNIQPGGGGGSVDSIQQRNFILAGAHAPGRIKKSRDRITWLLENDPAWKKRNSESISKGLLGNTIWLGKSHKKETKEKIGNKSAVHQRGSGNSQFGKIWVYSTVEKLSKSINQVELSIYLQNNWQVGRKLKFD